MFKKRRDGEITIVEVTIKDLDASIAAKFKDYLVTTLEDGGMVVLDVAAVEFMDSSCLGALIAAYRKLGSKGGLSVAGAQGAVKQMFKMARLSRVLPIYSNLEAALNG